MEGLGCNRNEKGMEGVDLGSGLGTWHGRGTGRNEVLKPNCYIVAGFFYLYDLVHVLVFLGGKRKDGEQWT